MGGGLSWRGAYRRDNVARQAVPDTQPPSGVFIILQKDQHHHSSLYNDASMPYTERLTWGGVALHAGGLPGYPSSHGCVHLPLEFAKLLFGITTLGTLVIIADGEPAYGDMQHPGLLIANHTKSWRLTPSRKYPPKPLIQPRQQHKRIRLLRLLSRPHTASSSHLLMARKVFQRGRCSIARKAIWHPCLHADGAGSKSTKFQVARDLACRPGQILMKPQALLLPKR